MLGQMLNMNKTCIFSLQPLKTGLIGISRKRKIIRLRCKVVSIIFRKVIILFHLRFYIPDIFKKQSFIQYAHSRENRLSISMS